MEWFFLLARADLLIVLLNPSVGPGLFGVVAFQSLVKEFVVHRLDILPAVGDIQMGAGQGDDGFVQEIGVKNF